MLCKGIRLVDCLYVYDGQHSSVLYISILEKHYQMVNGTSKCTDKHVMYRKTLK